MSEENEALSVHARIAALNLGHVGRAPVTAHGGKPLPEPRPLIGDRAQTTTNVPITLNGRAPGVGNEPNGARREGILPPPSNIVRTGQAQAQALAEQKASKPKPAAPPRIPHRRESSQPSPALPPRHSSGQLSRKASDESISSAISTISSISALSNGTTVNTHSRTPSMSGENGRIKAPVFDPAKLPPLPPKRTQQDAEQRYRDIEKSKAFPGHRDAGGRAVSMSKKSSPFIKTVEVTPPPQSTPALPPRTASRPESAQPALPARRPPSMTEHPPPKPARSALSFGMNKPEPEPQRHGSDHSSTAILPSRNGSAPPPVPLSSRPDLSKAQATKPQTLSPARAPNSRASCLHCRDFRGPDHHASLFPRESAPSLDWLVTQLVAPFPHSPTDQARVIFTWLHANIAYDAAAFFSGNLQPSTPFSTLQSGLAVCEGYASLFTALAVKAGLESIVISGHGKGFGYTPLKPGEAIPDEAAGHAWNAVKLDDGEWKLIDACWGAGYLCGGKYVKSFDPMMFNMDNHQFGLRHLPTDRSKTFRTDGKTMTWEEYYVGETGGESTRIFSDLHTEGILETSIQPRTLKISTKASSHVGPTVRFQFSRVCEHWDPVRNGPGKPYVVFLTIHGVDGRQDDYVPFETNGYFSWADIEPKRLGAPGQTITMYTVKTISGGDGRGLSVEEWKLAKGRKAMGFGGLAAWELI